jgi:hypothetical protein
VTDSPHCHYCQQPFSDPDDLRPYGPDGALVCFDCAMATPERKAEADRRMHGLLDAAIRTGTIRIGGGPPRAETETRPGDKVMTIPFGPRAEN